ncbi:MAG: DUF1080 domain-containing protein [Bacteroidales bacterium]|nr:DUF1080 domain-containing protein [Bacteroidales bacterium]
MKQLLYIMMIALAISSCKNTGTQATDEAKSDSLTIDSAATNALSAQEVKDSVILLFDGKTTDQWRSYGKETFPKGWKINDDAIHCIGSGKGEAGEGGDIITKEKFKNFELTLEWKISEGGNSGIFYLAQEIAGEPIWKSAPEMQVLDNEKHPDAKLGVDGNRQAGSLYDLIPAKPQNAKPVGEWNSVKIMVYKGTVVHYQNGVQVLEYHLWTDEWKKMCANSKFKDFSNFVNTATEGFIGLQDHGDDVWYRNIKIRKL